MDPEAKAQLVADTELYYDMSYTVAYSTFANIPSGNCSLSLHFWATQGNVVTNQSLTCCCMHCYKNVLFNIQTVTFFQHVLHLPSNIFAACTVRKVQTILPC